MTKTFFIIAGEASGDVLGAKLMANLKKLSSEEAEFYGVGGEKMEEQGLKSQFPMSELSLLGFMEILPHIPNLLNRIDQVAKEIISIKPDVVITIDAPAFNFRVARKLKDSGIKIVHYVAPSVWAYKPGRAKKIAKLYNHLLCLLPFEPPYFEKVGLSASFVGHPILEESFEGEGDLFRQKYSLNEEQKLICLMPGSRNSELERLLPVYKETISLLNKTFSNMAVVVLATERLKQKIYQETQDWPVKVIVCTERDEKNDALAASDIALAKSGTGTFEPAIAEVPMVIAYKVNPFSAWMLRRMIRIKYVNLLNIIMEREIIPELLQKNCTPEKLSDQISDLLLNEEKREEQLEGVKEALVRLGYGGKQSPSEKAARMILDLGRA